jgi:hypothetical protein
MGATYTVGNWTIDQQVTDTISTPKTLSIPDLDYVNDFTVVKKPLVGDVRLANTTAVALQSQEHLEYGVSPVANVYLQTDIAGAEQHPVKTGKKAVIKSSPIYQATNSVSGETLMLPLEIWTVMKVPECNLVTSQMVLDAVLRHISALFPTGAVDGSLITSVLRGDVNPRD